MTRTTDERIRDFLSEGPWAVAGASTDRSKYGNKVLRAYVQSGREPVYPLNPDAEEVEGRTAWSDLSSLPETPRAVSIVTPPAATEEVVAEAARLGIRRLWMQPGAESEAALALAEEEGIETIARGPCVLVVLGFREERGG